MVSIGHHSHRRLSLAGGHHASSDEPRPDSAGGPEDETTEVEPEQGSVLLHIISQLRPGADLSRVVLPTFILEPRSMLERITNFMAHPETLLPMPEVDDPLDRFLSVVKFYLSGWHLKPPGVKKPLNPILGERYTCYWEYPDRTRGYYISEQTSHHPPKSSYFYMAPEHHLRIDGTLKPRSKFLGNSAASMMEGIAILRILNRGHTGRGECYMLTQPNMYARGILFGKMKYELGDHSVVSCPENHLVADIEFKTKGYFSGGYNAIVGTIRSEKTGETHYELSGMWSGKMFIKDVVTGQQELLFDATNAKPAPPIVRPIEEQDDDESQRLWQKVVVALKERNHDVATDEKSRIEELQRARAAQRVEQGVEFRPRLFRPVRAGPGEPEEGEAGLDWILNANIDGRNPEELTRQILAVAPILQGQSSSTSQAPTSTTQQPLQVASTGPPPAGTDPSESKTGSAANLIDFGNAAAVDGASDPKETSGSGLPPVHDHITSQPDMQLPPSGLLQPLAPQQVYRHPEAISLATAASSLSIHNPEHRSQTSLQLPPSQTEALNPTTAQERDPLIRTDSRNLDEQVADVFVDADDSLPQ